MILQQHNSGILKNIIFLLTILFLCAAPAHSQRSKSVQPENKIKNYVTDQTGTLTSSQISDLETKLSSFDKQTSTQVVVFMIGTLGDGSLEDRSHDIAEQNGVGKKSKNNGVLLFIVKDDRKLRIEVGYGLEGALTDAISDQIIRKEIAPQFKQGNYYAGINAGVEAIIKVTKGEYTQDTKNNNDSGFGGLLCGLPVIFVLFFGFIVLMFIMRIISRIFGWRRFGGGGGWFSGGSGGWFSGGGGSSWGGGGFSGGGFSGGGGSFGGGGASGSW